MPLLFRIYTENPLLGNVPETRAAAATAHSLVRDGDLALNEYGIGGDDYARRWRNGRIYGIEPVASSLTFVPLFLRYQHLAPALLPIEAPNEVAAQVAILTLVVLLFWLLRTTTPARAMIAAATIALATSFRTISAAGLWQHTSGALWLTIGLFLWSAAPARTRAYPFAAAALAIATTCRPILVPAPLLLLADAWLVTKAPRRVATVSTALVLGAGLIALYANWRLHGSLLGGRVEIVSTIGSTHAVDAYFRFSMANLAGLLFAPSRGLFVYSPVLLFAIPGLVRCFRRSSPSPHRMASIAALAIFVLYGFIATWWGGWVFGPRYMTDLLPFFGLWLALGPAPRRARALVSAAFVATVVWSVLVQQLGASAYPCGWNELPVSIDQAPGRLWRWNDTELARCARKLVRPSEEAG
jgi:hypothetical protein